MGTRNGLGYYKGKREWQRLVTEASENKNKERILEECYQKDRGSITVKTKTKKLISILENEEYVRRPDKFITNHSKLIARANIMGRFGMLQCAANFSNGYRGKKCGRCKVEDNESHRINDCLEWKHINLKNSDPLTTNSYTLKTRRSHLK